MVTSVWMPEWSNDLNEHLPVNILKSAVQSCIVCPLTLNALYVIAFKRWQTLQLAFQEQNSCTV
jgi:hypothetical protein